MINWVDTLLGTLFGTLTVPRSWPLIMLVSLYAGWVANNKRRSALLWFGLTVGGFIAASEIVRHLVPDAAQELARGERPSAAYTIWTDAAFRALPKPGSRCFPWCGHHPAECG